MMGHVKTPMLGDPIPDRDQEARPRACSAACTCSCPAARGTGTGRSGPATASTRSPARSRSRSRSRSSPAGRRCRSRRDVALNQFGEVLGVYRILRVLTERKEARTRGKYADDRTRALHRRRLRAHRRHLRSGASRAAPSRATGRTSNVGDALPPDGEGPAHRHRDHRLPRRRLRLRALRAAVVSASATRTGERIAPFYVKNEHGVWDVAQRLHWDSQWAKAIGNPMAYDYGVLRQCVVLPPRRRLGRRRRLHREDERLDPQVQLPWATRSSSRARWSTSAIEGGRRLVDLKLTMVNQRDIETAYGTAIVSLPSREAGLPPMPPRSRRPGTAGGEHVRPPQRAEGAAAVRRVAVPETSGASGGTRQGATGRGAGTLRRKERPCRRAATMAR